MDPLYTCDFCLKQFTETQLKQCFHCHEIFCGQCVQGYEVLYERPSGEKILSMYYCTDDCKRRGPIIPTLVTLNKDTNKQNGSAI